MRGSALQRMHRASTEATDAYRRMKLATTTAELDRCMGEFMAAIRKWDEANAELQNVNDAIAAMGRHGGG